MPLARLENFLKNLNGNTLYVDPNELDSTDSIENRGNSRLRPFKTIQRALLEAARFSYVSGSNNDLFDQTTIIISPGTHYIDNRPGYYVDSSNVVKNISGSTKTILEFNILSNFDINDTDNELYIYNSVDGGVILPKGTSLVATDLRKTKIRPLFVPDPNQSSIGRSSIFRLTGSCYFYGFSIYDGDPFGKVYNTYSATKVTPSYSHHKLTAFEYADGVNDVIKNGSNTGHTDLEMYYYKLALGFGQQSGRSIIDGYNNFQPNVDEYRIVGELGAGAINIVSVTSTGTNVITVTTETEHQLSPLTPILISSVGLDEGAPTTSEYNGNFVVSQILSSTSFTYLIAAAPTGSLSPSVGGASVKVISDTTTSSSPYIFNCSLKSVYGLNGLHADGSKATGFKSMVTAQFTGISLQKDDRAFVRYDETSGSYYYQSNFGIEKFLHQDPDSIYQPDWSSFHIKASNDAFIQCVSIFAIGYTNQFVSDSGGDQSITNSNSNFGQNALFSEGFKSNAFPKDDHGFITHIIPPKDASTEEQNINSYFIDITLPNSSTKIYLQGYNDILTPPNSKVRGYSIGGKFNDKIYYNQADVEYYADITPNYKISTNVTSVDTVNDYLNLSSISGISTGLAVKVIAKNSILPDGIEHERIYFARPVTGTNIRIYENLANCNADTAPVEIKNSNGVTSNNLYVVSKISDLSSGDVGSPIQWDSTYRNWYVGITINAGSPNFVTNLSALTSPPILYLKRVIDTRSDKDKIYRVRYVVPKDSSNAAVPGSGFVFQRSGSVLNSSYGKGISQVNPVELSSPTGNQLSAVRNKNIIVDAYYSSGIATVISKNPHNLKVGNKVSVYNLKSSNEPNPTGLGTGTGFNGEFEVVSVPNDLTFSYSISVNPGTITSGSSAVANWLSIPRNCSQSSNFRVPPYTVYDANRETLPYFTCDQIENHYQISDIREIQKYVQGSTDGIYHLILDSFKNIPPTSPFNTSEYKFGQNIDNVYPKADPDNLTVDPDPSITAASGKTIGLVDISDPYLSSTKEILIQYFKDFNIGKKITGFVKSGNNVTITTSENHGIGGVRRVVAASLGSGYTDGIYYDIPLCGGTGSNATVNLRVSGGVPSNFEIANPGSGYTISDTLSIKGIPGSTNATTVTASILNFDSADSDLIQILGATNSGNNGQFIISSITANTITFENTSGVTESTTNAVMVLSGLGYPITGVYDSNAGITTVTTGALDPHSFAIGNKVIFNDSTLGICTVTSVNGINSFTVKGNVSSANKVYSIGLIPTLKDTNSLNENLSTRNFVPYCGYKSRLGQNITSSTTLFTVSNTYGLSKGDFIQIENEIMLVTRVSGSVASVKRALFGTQAVSHPQNGLIKTIYILPAELRRPSILRASGHTFEYVGFGPGNYSTAMPSNQTKVLNDNQVRISQALNNRGGLVVYSGMNSNGEFFIGRRRWDAATGKEIQYGGVTATSTSTTQGGDETTGSFFDTLTVNTLVVNQKIDATTAIENLKTLDVIGNSSLNTLNASGNTALNSTLKVVGVSTFNSNVTISGTLTPNAIADKDGQVGAAGSVLTSTGSQLDWRNINDLTSGRVVQFVRGTYNVITTHTTSWGDTGLTATITPSSVNSKIIILVNQGYNYDGGDTPGSGGIKIVRGTTDLYNPSNEAFSISTSGAENENLFNIVSLQYIDTPSTTSPVTYKTQGIKTNNNFYTNKTRDGASLSQIYLIEIS